MSAIVAGIVWWYAWLGNWIEAHSDEVFKLIGILAAACTVAWQIGRQYRNSLSLQRDNARQALKLRIYETLLQRIRVLTDSLSQASMYAFKIVPAMHTLRIRESVGLRSKPTVERAMIFSELHFKAFGYAADLLIEIDSWSIAFPGVEVFRVALNAAIYDSDKAFGPLFEALLAVLPLDPPDGKGDVVVPPLPSAEEFARLKHLINTYKDAMDTMSLYAQDLTVDAQNALLTGIFDRKVKPRLPIDPKHKVITSEPNRAVELIEYFQTETSWGKNQATICAEVRADVVNANTAKPIEER